MDQHIKEVVLEFVEGENEGVELRITPPRTLILGRSEECDIYLGEKKISRNHCHIKVEENNVFVIDLESTNGTFINKEKISGQVEIKEKDRLQVGTTVIKFVFHKEVSIAADSTVIPDKPHESILSMESGVEVSQAERDLDHQSPSGLMDSIETNDKEENSEQSEESLSSSLSDENAVDATDHVIEEPSKSQKILSTEEKSKTLSGSLSAMGLADLLQNFSQNKKSGILELESDQKGKIILFEGKIVGAKLGNVDGEKALFRLLSWNQGTFELNPLDDDFDMSSLPSPLEDSTENLLMEGFRQYDEIQRFEDRFENKTKKLKIKSKLEAPLSKLHPRVLDVLQVALNEKVIQKVLDESQLSDLETTKILYYLVQKEYLEIK